MNSKGAQVYIQEHSLGHSKATSGHGAEPHFNVRSSENVNTGNVPGTHGHYNF
nr:HNH/endonuclease VII fold putative polymorphic toxin [Siccibacter turicensis]